jgi:hypothetical protein
MKSQKKDVTVIKIITKITIINDITHITDTIPATDVVLCMDFFFTKKYSIWISMKNLVSLTWWLHWISSEVLKDIEQLWLSDRLISNIGLASTVLIKGSEKLYLWLLPAVSSLAWLAKEGEGGRTLQSFSFRQEQLRKRHKFRVPTVCTKYCSSTRLFLVKFFKSTGHVP